MRLFTQSRSDKVFVTRRTSPDCLAVTRRIDAGSPPCSVMTSGR